MEAVAERTKVTDLPDDKLVAAYVQLRDRRAQRKAAYENDDADDKRRQEKIEGILLYRFQESGHESIRTEYGTAYKETKATASIADWESFFPWMQERELWEFLEHRPNKKNIQQYKEEFGDLPPGINWSEAVTIRVRRS